MDLYQEDNQMSATLSDKNGEKVTLKIDGNTSLSGESQFGQYIIAAERCNLYFFNPW